MNKTKLWSKNYIILILANVLSAFGFNMMSTLLSKYLVNLGVPLAVAGVIVGMFSITALFIRPASGVIADRFNKKNILMLANIMIGIAVLGYTLSNIVWVIAVFRVLHGIAFGVSGTTAIALASENIPKERTGEGLGYVALGQIVSVAVAPGLGIMLAERFGYNATFVCSFVFSIAAALMLFLFFKVDNPIKKIEVAENRKFNIRNLIAKEAILFAIISGAMSLNNGIVNGYILLFAEKQGLTNISIYFIVTAATMLAIRPMAGKLMDKYGVAVVVIPAFAFGVVAMFLHGLSTTIWMLGLAAVFKAIAAASIQTSLLAESLKRAGRGRSGIATSTFYIGADIGQGVGPMIGGAIAAMYGYKMMFYFCGVITLIAGLIFVISSVIEKKKKIGSDVGALI